MSKVSILIVEDEAIVAEDLAGKLGRLGYEVAAIASEGDEAVALTCRLHPTLVLMDISLGGPMDGIESARAIRCQHDVPVVYLTAHSDSATLARAKLTGPFGYILKPFDERDLATQIELALYKHQADRQLRQQREWLHVTLRSIGDAVIATDASGRVTFLNPVAESLVGWKAEEAAGQPIQCVFRIVNEQTGLALEEPVGRVLREGRAVELANHAAVVTKDGRTVPIEDSAAPILDAAGQVIGAVLVFHDVTEKRRGEQALRASEARVRRKLESVLTPEGDIGTLELSDVMDAEAVQALMNDFYKIARLPMSILDLKGNVLVGVGWQKICMAFHRIHPETCRHCTESDLHLTVDIPPGESRLYKCENRMWDIATPIYVGGQHLGNIFSGQFFFDDETVDEESFRGQAQRYGFDEKEYLAALAAVPRLSRTAVDAGMAFFIKLAKLLSQLGYSNIKLARSLADRTALMSSLRESQERLQTTLNSITGGYYALDEQWRFVALNSAAEQHFGRPAAEVIGQTIWEVTAVPPAASLRCRFEEARGSGRPLHFEAASPVRPGAWSELHLYPRDGLFEVYFADITERKRREEQIVKLTRLYVVLSQVNEAIVRAKSGEALYAEVCRIVAEQGGFPLAWIGQVREQQVIPVAACGPAADYVKEIRVELQGELGGGPTGTCIRENRAVVNDDFAVGPATAPWRKPALHYGFHASAAFPLRRQGKAIGALTLYAREPSAFDAEQVGLLESLSADLSYALDALDHEQCRVHAEQALRESEARYRKLFTTMSEGFALHELICDGEGKPCDYRFLEVNPAFEQATGLKAEEVVGRTLREVLPDTELVWLQRYSRVVLTGEPDHFEDYHQPTGRWYEVYASRTGPTQFAVVFLNITDRKRAEVALLEAKAAAEAANEAKSQFLANMSHELRTPMNAILGMIDVALPKAIDPIVQDCLQTAKGSADLLLTLLNDLLDSAKIESGKLELESAPFSLRRMLDQITRVLAVRASEKGLSFYCRLPDETPDAIVGDRTRLQQVLLNLASNAIKFTECGEVEISLRALSHNGEACLEFAVRDTGIGIPPSGLKRLFQPFAQADASTARHFGGTGLGLSISKSLVEMMGGRIWAESEVGKGSTFQFTVGLPLARAIPPDFEAPAVLPAAACCQLRVLLVEDNPANQKLATYILQDRGHQVEIAADGHEALCLTERNCYDVILMDVQMPGMDGLEATAAIRKRENGENRVPIIAMTAHAMKGDRQRCLAAGMDGYLSKPVNAREMIGLVESLAGGAVPAAQLPAAVLDPAEAQSCETLPVFNPEEALTRCFNSADMVREMIQSFQDEVTNLFPQMRAALEKGDLVEVGRLGHRIKGTIVYLGAQPAKQAAVRLEQFCRSSGGSPSEAAEAINAFEHECIALKAELAQHPLADRPAAAEINDHDAGAQRSPGKVIGP